MAFRVRKAFGTFKKRAPGLTRGSLKIGKLGLLNEGTSQADLSSADGTYVCAVNDSCLW